MIKKLTSTLPNLVHTIFAKLNKDDTRGEERGAPASSSSSSSSKPVPSSKQAKNPFFLTRDYLDHTLETISAKTGMVIPPHVYHALMNCLLTNNHLVIDSSYIENCTHATGYALFNMLPYLVNLRCSYVMCTSSTSPNEIFRKLVDPHFQSQLNASTDSDLELTASTTTIPLSQSMTTPSIVPLVTPATAPAKHTRSSMTADAPTAPRGPNTTKHQRRQSRLRYSETYNQETIQQALNPNATTSQTTLPPQKSDRVQERGQGPIYAQVLVVDNLMTAPPKTLAALYQVMNSRQVPLKGYKYNTPSVFIIVAVTGKKCFPTTTPAPFSMNIPVFDPLVALNTGEPAALAFGEGELLQARAAVPATFVAQDMHQYMRSIVMALRNHSAVDVGPDTLAVSALENAARAAAVIAGQKFVTPTHILSVVAQILNHRASLSPQPLPPPHLAFASSSAPVHATSRFMAYVSAGCERNKQQGQTKNKTSITSPNNNTIHNTTSTTTTTTTTTSIANSPPIHEPNSNPNSPPLHETHQNPVTYYAPNFPTPPSADVFANSFQLLEFLLNNIDTPV